MIAKVTTAGNVHDSTSFHELRKEVMKLEESKNITFEVLDAGYKTPAITREIIEDKKVPLLLYTRPKGQKGKLRKKDFTYNEEKDVYICPNDEELKYSTTDKIRGLEKNSKNATMIFKCHNLKKWHYGLIKNIQMSKITNNFGLKIDALFFK